MAGFTQQSAKRNVQPPERASEESGSAYKKSRNTPVFVRGLLFLLVSSLGLLGLRLLPEVALDGWRPIVALLAGLGLITAALVEVMRAR